MLFSQDEIQYFDFLFKVKAQTGSTMVMAETVPADTLEMTEVRDARILRKKRSVMKSFSEVSSNEVFC